MSGYLLILAIIVLGGAIATIGDRLGTRVGKARLSLFNLRPKQTAVIVTILTGTIISTATVGILLATNSQLRYVLTRIDEIGLQSKQAQEKLAQAIAQKNEAENDFEQAELQLKTAIERLRKTNNALKEAKLNQKRSESKLKQLITKFNQTQFKTKELQTKISQLSQTSRRLEAEQITLIQQRNAAQANLATANTQRFQLESKVQEAQSRLQAVAVEQQKLEVEIQQAQAELKIAQKQEIDSRKALEKVESELESANTQRAELQQDIASLSENRKRLERNVQILTIGLRQGNVTIRTGQVLASAVIENQTSRESALRALDQLRQQARIAAIIRTNPQQIQPNERVIQFIPQDVESVVDRLSDGGSYVVRILSALNYLEGEQSVLVIPQIAPNRKIYQADETLSAIQFKPEPQPKGEAQVVSKLNALFALTREKAIRDGILADPITGNVGEFNSFKLLRFALAILEINDPGTIQVITVTSEAAFTAGPLEIDLIAIKDNQVILRSN